MALVNERLEIQVCWTEFEHGNQAAGRIANLEPAISSWLAGSPAAVIT